jgi:hypothetical protein
VHVSYILPYLHTRANVLSEDDGNSIMALGHASECSGIHLSFNLQLPFAVILYP